MAKREPHRATRAPSTQEADVEEFARRVMEAEQRVRHRCRAIHPFDLHTIIHALLTPLDRRVMFLKRRADGGFGF